MGKLIVMHRELSVIEIDKRGIYQGKGNKLRGDEAPEKFF